MTLIAASLELGEMVSDDSVVSNDLLYRSFDKVIAWREGYLGLAGDVGPASTIKCLCGNATTLEELSDLFVESVSGSNDSQSLEPLSVDGLLLMPWGIYLFDSYGMLIRLEDDFAAIGSGAPAAMAINKYFDTVPGAEALCLPSVVEAVSKVTPSVSPRYKLYYIDTGETPEIIK